MFLIGVFQSFLVVLVSAFFFVYIRFFSENYAINPIVFTTMSMIATALSLSIVAGPGKYISTTLKSWQTWLYGFLLIGTYIIDIVLVETVSATETGLLNRLTIPFTLVFAFIFFARKPSFNHLIGNIFIVIGFSFLFWYQGLDVWQHIWLPVLLVILCNAGSFVIAEIHKEYTEASQKGTIRDRFRVVAFVSFITAVIFLGISFSFTWLKESVVLLQSISVIPSKQSYFHAPSILSGVFYGIIFAPISRYCIWSASQNIKSENVLAILALIPLMAFFLEFFVQGINGEVWSINTAILLPTIFICFGAMLPVFLKMQEEVSTKKLPLWKAVQQSISLESKNISIHHSATAVDDYEVVCATLEYTSGDKDKAANLLGVTSATLTVLHEGKGTLALESEYSQQIMRRYRREVANKDALTGLLSRSGFMTAFKQHIEGAKSASILFIDLNKFKPVNDTYGHDAGDFILQGVGERLTKLFKNDSYVCRLGGDEFAVLCLGIDENQAITKAEEIKKVIAEPFNFNGNAITVGASVGIAIYPTDSTDPEELLKKSDEGMYREKEER